MANNVLLQAAAAGAGVGAAYEDMNRPVSSGPAAGYVPYADVYSNQNQQAYAADQRYAQAQADAHNDPYGAPRDGDGHARQGREHDDRERDRGRGRHDDNRHDNRRSGSDSRSRSSSDDSRRRRHQRKRDKSRSRRGSPQPSNRSRARSTIRDKFDTSDRGLGYGTIGAIAGGLAGSEVGKGLWPTVAGAVIGGLGANAFESREK